MLFSINALKQLGSFECHEEFIDNTFADGDLIRMLYSIAVSINADPATVFWGVLTEVEMTPVPVQSLEINAGQLLEASYVVTFAGQESVVITFIG